jgi:hypothetical protein
MTVSHDVFAEINPAFCTYALVNFTSAFQKVRPQGAEVPLAYLALPIALSGDLAFTFEKTNRTTGLSTWMNRHPKIMLDLDRRIDASLDMVSESIRFACFTETIAWKDTRLLLGSFAPKKIHALEYGDAIINSLKRAERLGYWLAGVGSQRAIFNIMGLSV